MSTLFTVLVLSIFVALWAFVGSCLLIEHVTHQINLYNHRKWLAQYNKENP